NSLVKNFETLQFIGAEGATDSAFDASKLSANYTSIDFASDSFVDNVGTQALIANGKLTAEAAGYKAAGGTTLAAVYAGILDITEKFNGTVTANAESVVLTVDASN